MSHEPLVSAYTEAIPPKKRISSVRLDLDEQAISSTYLLHAILVQKGLLAKSISLTMAPASAATGHLLLVAAPGWGHLRPLTAFACKVVQERPSIVITLPTVGGFSAQVDREIDRYLATQNADGQLKEQIRVVNLGGDGLDPLELMPILFGEFEGLYKKLITREPIQCCTGTIYEAVRTPNAAVIDLFGLSSLQTIRALTGSDVPVLSWTPVTASVMLRFFGPESLGGVGDIALKSQKEAERTGRDPNVVAEELHRSSRGEVVLVPGLPPMYDYEWSPQKPTEEIPHVDFLKIGYSSIQACDGVVSITSAVYESESVYAAREWLRETNRGFYAVGPLVPPGLGEAGLSGVSIQKEMESSDQAGEFQSFLDKALQKHGRHSVLYMSFGSVWWPNNEHVWAFVNTLLELKFPFIMAHPSPRAIVPPEVAKNVKASGIGLLSAWAPQQTILNHPATGWFLTHCGQNSITEALAQGMPMIAWPIDGDQPANAALLTLTLDVAFELVQVRTGLGLKPLHRGVQPAGTIEAVVAEAHDILHRIRGHEGTRKRRNAHSLRDKMGSEWEEGGESLQMLREFLKHYI